MRSPPILLGYTVLRQLGCVGEDSEAWKCGAGMMPWTTDDVDRHKKGLSMKEKELWVRVANEALERTGDEGRAIREANAVVNRAEES